MERLTMIDGIGNDELVRCMGCGLEKAGENLENCGFCEEGWQKALKKLAAYEDTGLDPEDLKKTFNEELLLTMTAQMMGITPERLRELVEADRDGRCVVLPLPLHRMLFDVSDPYRPEVLKDFRISATWTHNGIVFARTAEQRWIWRMSMRLIDADALMEEEYTWLREGDVLYRIPPSHIDLAPTIDAVPVVRCRECVYATRPGDNIIYCDNFERDMVPDDYCSVGYREETP